MSNVGPPGSSPTPAIHSVLMPRRILYFAVGYTLGLVGIFIAYASSEAFRANAPSSFGQIPVGVVWFGAIGAVLASLYGIFVHNQDWDPSYDYWHYCRPLCGAITGSIGSLLYLVLLNIGNTSAVKVDRPTFYVAAFVFGFADKAFLQMVHNVTSVIIKPGKTSN